MVASGLPPWIRLHNEFVRHPKVADLTDAAFRLHIVGMSYASAFLTDGWVPDILVGRSLRAVAELVDAGLWEHHPDSIGYVIHDYLVWQESRAEVEARRKQRSEAGRRGAAKRWQPHGASHDGDHGASHDESHGASDGKPIADTDTDTDTDT
jgi:hypothetical protein